MIYQHDPASEPDEAFEPGQMDHLVAGNEGRLLDSRRTPAQICRVRPEVGLFEVEILAFEDRGARWEMAFEDVERFQFRRGGQRLSTGLLAEYRAIAARLGYDVQIPAEAAARTRTEELIQAEQERAKVWLFEHVHGPEEIAQHVSRTVHTGLPALMSALQEYLARAGVADIEAAFARAYASNPQAGEVVRGHAFMLARLGLVSYRGRALRDPASLSGAWSEQQRAAHIRARLAFVRAMFDLAQLDRVLLYRGYASERPRRKGPPQSFVSATFDRAVALAHFEGNERTSVAALYRQRVPVSRLFMTYLETAALNDPYQEAEAVLLRAGANNLF